MKIITKAIESAQKQVEAQNFEMRKNVLKYDDVMTTLVEQARGQTAPVERWHPGLHHRVPRDQAVL